VWGNWPGRIAGPRSQIRKVWVTDGIRTKTSQWPAQWPFASESKCASGQFWSVSGHKQKVVLQFEADMAAMTLRHGFGLLQELWDERVEAQVCAGSEQSQKLFVYRLTLNNTTQQQDFTRPYKEERRSYNATVLQCARPIQTKTSNSPAAVKPKSRRTTRSSLNAIRHTPGSRLRNHSKP
jgi:hypothetical protein